MCSDIRLLLAEYCEKYGIVCGRTMEFREPLNSKLVIVPKNKSFISITPFYTLEWINIYGYVGIKVLDSPEENSPQCDSSGKNSPRCVNDIIVDGMNEVGLSCGVLTLDDTYYEEISGSSVKAISILDICAWILGTCSSVYDAIDELKTVKIWGEPIPILNRLIGLHIIIHDIKGNSIVCELLESGLNICSTDGVVTNGPPFPQQLEILQQYREVNKSISDNWSSITRFIKLSELKRLCIPESLDTLGLVQLISHMFNNIDIIRGVSNDYRYDNPHQITQWCLVKDLTYKLIYFRSYNNMSLRRLDLNKINFSETPIYPEILLDDAHPTIFDISL